MSLLTGAALVLGGIALGSVTLLGAGWLAYRMLLHVLGITKLPGGR